MYTARQPQIPPFGKKCLDFKKKVMTFLTEYILGDLNVDFLNIPPSHIIHDILQHNTLTNTIVHEPTRFTHSTQTLILTSHDLTVAETGTLQTDARLSDHKTTYLSLKLEYDTRHAYKRKIWQYKDADTDKLNYLIETFD